MPQRDAGKLPARFTRAGRHRRLVARDVLKLKAWREAEHAATRSAMNADPGMSAIRTHPSP